MIAAQSYGFEASLMKIGIQRIVLLLLVCRRPSVNGDWKIVMMTMNAGTTIVFVRRTKTVCFFGRHEFSLPARRRAAFKQKRAPHQRLAQHSH